MIRPVFAPHAPRRITPPIRRKNRRRYETHQTPVREDGRGFGRGFVLPARRLCRPRGRRHCARPAFRPGHAPARAGPSQPGRRPGAALPGHGRCPFGTGDRHRHGRRRLSRGRPRGGPDCYPEALPFQRPAQQPDHPPRQEGRLPHLLPDVQTGRGGAGRGRPRRRGPVRLGRRRPHRRGLRRAGRLGRKNLRHEPVLPDILGRRPGPRGHRQPRAGPRRRRPGQVHPRRRPLSAPFGQPPRLTPPRRDRLLPGRHRPGQGPARGLHRPDHARGHPHRRGRRPGPGRGRHHQDRHQPAARPVEALRRGRHPLPLRLRARPPARPSATSPRATWPSPRPRPG